MAKQNVTDAGIDWFRVPPEQFDLLNDAVMTAARGRMVAVKAPGAGVATEGEVLMPCDGKGGGRGYYGSREPYGHGDRRHYTSIGGEVICLDRAQAELSGWQSQRLLKECAKDSNAGRWAAHVVDGAEAELVVA